MNDAQRKDIWNTFHKFYKSRVKAFAPKINAALKSQINHFIKAKMDGKSDASALATITPGSLIPVLKSMYKDAATVYGAKHLSYLRSQKARLPIGYNEMMTRLIEQYFRTELLNTSEEITQQTRELIQAVLIDAYPKGLSFDEIVALLESPDFTAYRARRIARTETNTAANTGAMIAAKSTGLKLEKTWISAQDNRTRRIPRDQFDHLHMDNVTIPYEEQFHVNSDHGNENMAQPGDNKGSAGNRINCRCTIGFSGVRDASGRLVRQ